MSDVEEAVTRVHHEEWARVVASLTRRFGDLDIAEEAAAEAFAPTVEHREAQMVYDSSGKYFPAQAPRTDASAGNAAFDRKNALAA
ncbi:MAG TPA: hypothetical protein VHN16_07685 [Streptosporangiaceae bacterium]|nr:hypothetical protein [Streptosporangiaceae bacterium]